jgi:N utilization substance protein B|tara:strand:+ start:65 stop:538 length:474 start_codon:yes stop_codon:yes gene_type:complete
MSLLIERMLIRDLANIAPSISVPYKARRSGRVLVIQALYEIDEVKHDPEETMDRWVKEYGLSPSAENFSRKLLLGVLENLERIDIIIGAHAPEWPINQIAAIDRNLLRTTVYEIVIATETPPKAAINEAVEIAKIFGSDNSPKFINGVLGSVMEEIG